MTIIPSSQADDRSITVHESLFYTRDLKDYPNAGAGVHRIKDAWIDVRQKLLEILTRLSIIGCLNKVTQQLETLPKPQWDWGFLYKLQQIFENAYLQSIMLILMRSLTSSQRKNGRIMIKETFPQAFQNRLDTNICRRRLMQSSYSRSVSFSMLIDVPWTCLAPCLGHWFTVSTPLSTPL